MQSGSGTGTSSFESFLEGWFVRQQHYLDELLSVRQHCHEIGDEDLKDLVGRILAHYQKYYEEKSMVAQRDVFLLFSPTWFTSFERTFIWIAGFKPGMAFHLAKNSVDDLSEDQQQRMKRLMEETKVEERTLNHELAKIQESVAAPPLLEILSRGERERERSVDGEIREKDAVFAAWRSALESVVANADALRTNSVMKVLEVLSPAQSVRFLTAVSQLYLRIRNWGLQREAEAQQ